MAGADFMNTIKENLKVYYVRLKVLFIIHIIYI
jgi:hypothetical protein